MAKTNAVIEAAERHADRVIGAAQALEAEARRLRDHALNVRANTRTGNYYTDAEIENFDRHKIADIEIGARIAIEAIEGKR
jgi:hypothetical protein